MENIKLNPYTLSIFIPLLLCIGMTHASEATRCTIKVNDKHNKTTSLIFDWIDDDTNVKEKPGYSIVSLKTNFNPKGYTLPNVVGYRNSNNIVYGVKVSFLPKSNLTIQKNFQILADIERFPKSKNVTNFTWEGNVVNFPQSDNPAVECNRQDLMGFSKEQLELLIENLKNSNELVTLATEEQID